MKVKDVVCAALRFVGREDVASSLSAGSELSGEAAQAAQTMLFCFNAAEDEVARMYFPLKAEQTLSSSSGMYDYGDFSRPPVKIKRVTDGKKNLKFELFPQYMRVDCKKITVSYTYSPNRKTMEEESEYSALAVGETLLAYGAAAEYLLINGEAEASAEYEKKYRGAIDSARGNAPISELPPPRLWV